MPKLVWALSASGREAGQLTRSLCTLHSAGARGGGQRTFVGNVGMTVAEENPAPLFSEMRSQEINPNGLSYPRHVGIAGLLSAKSLA